MAAIMRGCRSGQVITPGRLPEPHRDRTRLDDLEGARIWAGHCLLAHNLVKISVLAA